MFGNVHQPHVLELPSGEVATVATCSLTLRPWTGASINDTYGNKPVIDSNGEPLFAELAVLRQLRLDGFDGVWVDSFRGKFRRAMPPNECLLPALASGIYDNVVAKNGRKGGCWDLLTWKGDEVLFVELKRRGRDAIRENQRKWLDSALSCGLDLKQFLICEWDMLQMF